MRTSDVAALGEVASVGVTVLTDAVRGVHGGIASRVFTSIGPSARPVAAVHDAVAGTIYGIIDQTGRRVPAALRAVASPGWAFDDNDQPLDEYDVPGELIAALNGIYGDELDERRNSFATVMGVRVGGRRVALDAESIAAAYPAATANIAVFVHGLCQTEGSWDRTPRDPAAGDPRRYGDRLADDLGYTPVFVRYNTGRHISSNGRDLDALLAALTASWPVPVERIALIGHSMGGLVVRSAAHYADRADHAWCRAVRHVVCLGSPHLGSEVEKGVNVASWALSRLRETRALADFLNLRSDGIKDLRYGACLDEDWQHFDPDEFLRDRCGEFVFLPHASYHFVATSASPHLVGMIVGDHLVRPRSASGVGRTRSVPFEPDDGLVMTGFHHFDLLNHPDIYAKLVGWLAPRQELTAATRELRG